MTVTPDKTARAARAVEALLARHAELQGVLEHWAGVLAATAVSSARIAKALRRRRVPRRAAWRAASRNARLVAGSGG